MSLKDPAVEQELAQLVKSHRTLKLFLAGPGWVDVQSAHGARSDSLAHAVDQLAETWAGRS